MILWGKLTFSQDLIYSRILNQSYQQKKYSHFDPENVTSHNLSRPFVLLKNELLSATINKPILETFKAISSNKEFSELLNLTLDSAMFFLDNNCIEDPEIFCKHLLSDKGKQVYNTKKIPLQILERRNGLLLIFLQWLKI